MIDGPCILTSFCFCSQIGPSGQLAGDDVVREKMGQRSVEGKALDNEAAVGASGGDVEGALSRVDGASAGPKRRGNTREASEQECPSIPGSVDAADKIGDNK